MAPISTIKNTKVYGTEWTYFFFGWNNNSPSAPFFADRKVREAMSYAFDYRELLDKLLFGLCEQCTGITHPEAWYAPKTPLTPYMQDLDKAEKLLDEAGWIDSDGDGIRDKLVNGQRVKFEFDMIVKNDPRAHQNLRNHAVQSEAIGNHVQHSSRWKRRSCSKSCCTRNIRPNSAAGAPAPIPDEDENVWATQRHAARRAQLFVVHQSRGRQAV